MIAPDMIQAHHAADADLLSGYSFEISGRDADRLADIRPFVPAGTVVSITYLPTESDAARIAAAEEVRRLGLVPMPHIAARRLRSADDLARIMDAFGTRAAVDRLFVIAGDLPDASGPFPDALAVIEALPFDRFGIRTVAIAGYPDGHPGIDRTKLDRARVDKIAALEAQGVAVEIMTQFAFDADPIARWLHDIRADGFGGFVRLGVPGPANVRTLLRFAAVCGVASSAKVLSKYGASITKLLNTAGPDRLYADLSRAIDPCAQGPVSIHLYPFGGLRKMAEWAYANAPTER